MSGKTTNPPTWITKVCKKQTGDNYNLVNGINNRWGEKIKSNEISRKLQTTVKTLFYYAKTIQLTWPKVEKNWLANWIQTNSNWPRR